MAAKRKASRFFLFLKAGYPIIFRTYAYFLARFFMKFKNMTFIFVLILIQMPFLLPAISERQCILKKIENLTLEEKKDLTSFFKICFCSFEFGYTIFGQKPMSLDAINLKKRSLEDYGEYKDSEWILCDYRKKDGWDVWKKHFETIEMNGFSLIFYPVPHYPELIHFSIINHKNFLCVLEENLDVFQTVLNRKIASQEILNAYKKGEGEIFNTIKNHEGLLGILLGFGKENAFKFMNKEKLSPSVDPMSLKGQGMENIRLPRFMVAEGSNETKKIMQSFSRQQESINQIYQKENFLELVLVKLFCTD
jgi:hypothetical protein